MEQIAAEPGGEIKKRDATDNGDHATDAALMAEAADADFIVDRKENSWRVVDALAYFYAQYGKSRHARALYAALYAQFPENRRFGLGLASARLACEDFEGCLKLATYLGGLENPSPSAFFLMARAHHALGHTQEAKTAVEAFFERTEQLSNTSGSSGI